MKAIKEARHNLRFFPRQHIIVLGGLVALLLLSQFLLHIPSHKQRLELQIAAEKFTPPVPVIQKKAAAEGWQWREEKVRSGDNLSHIFKRVGVSDAILDRILHCDSRAEQLQQIYPGNLFRFAFDENHTLMALQYAPSKLEQFNILRNEDGSFSLERIYKQPDIQLAYRHATIEGSLFVAGAKANIPEGMIMQIANVFGGVIDFVFDPRKGDTFDILYEEEYLDGEKIGNGNLLVASYASADEAYYAYRYEFEDGRSGYFNEAGISMHKPFLRAPLDFTRISSGFNLQRMHPLHKKIKAHRGIDYAAPTGTPVFAAGDGRVLRAGFSKANGNYVFIKHGEEYVTKYLHLHKRYVKTGQKVKQRDIIGTVGSTGYATGPHLHYEFLVNGVHRNPRTIFNKLPSAAPVPEEEKQRFAQQLQFLQHQYSSYKTNSGEQQAHR